MSSPPIIRVSPDLILRAIRPEDHPRHHSLMERIYPPAFAYLWPDAGAWYVHHVHGRKSFERDLAQPDARYYHVFFREELVGIYRLKLNTEPVDFPGEPGLKLDRLYLDDAIRGQGIGSALVEHAKRETSRLGKSILWLERMDTNEATIAFYRKCGFTDGSAFRLTFDRMHPEFRGMRRLWWRPALSSS